MASTRLIGIVRAVATAAALLLFPAAQGAAINFTHFTKAGSGLCYDGVKTMMEDSRGILWIGSYKGLSSYDGHAFTNYDRSDFGIDSDYVSSLAEDQEGNIWIGTDYGIVVFDRRKLRFHSFGTNIINSRVYCMVRDSQGRIWIGIRGKGVYRSNGKSIESVPGTSDIEDVYRIVFDWKGRAYLASYCKDLLRLDGDSVQSACNGFFKFDDISGLAFRTVDEGSVIYVAAKRQGLCEILPGSDQVRCLYKLGGVHRPTGLSTESGKLWLSSTGGIVSYDLSSGIATQIRSVPEDPFSLSDDYTTCAITDLKGGLWVGTNSGGVNYYHPDHDRFRNYWKDSEGKRLEGAIIRGFAEDSHGRIWIATEKKGLLVMTSDGIPAPYTAVAGLPRHITALATDGDFLWLGSQQGIWRLNISGADSLGQSLHYPQLGGSDEENDNRVVSLYKSHSGNLYVCTPVGVRVYNEEKASFDFVEALKGITVEQLAEDGGGRLWAASYSQGAFCYDPKSGSLESFGVQIGKGPVHEMTSSLCVDRGGAVWVIGFSTGFYRYSRSGGNFEHYHRDNVPALPTDLYLSALADQKGRLWLSGDSGLVEFGPASKGVSVFRVADGLLSDNFSKSALKLSDGTMLFGCTDGFVRFNPSEFGNPTILPTPARHGFFHTRTGKATAVMLVLLGIVAFAVLLMSIRATRKERRHLRQMDERRKNEAYHEKLDFFSNIIHEIKTPLTLIRTPLQQLLDSGSASEEQKADLNIIRNSTDYLDQLVKELLEFVRVEEHGYVPDLRNTDIVERLGFVCYNFSETAKNSNIRLKYDSDPESIVTAVDTKALSKIFNNLIHNAVKYSESWIKIHASIENGSVVVRFCNDGASIPAEHRESIFLPFVRYTDKKSEYTQSFGIGLAQARKLAELQGGSLILSDRADCTEFILTLPLRQAAETAQETLPAEEENHPEGSRPLLLLVEDNGDLASYLKRKLKEDYEVIAVPSAEKALEKLEKFKVDLLLTDIGLQSMSGVELCRKVSGNPATSHIPIIVISAISSTDTKIKCMENGATIYIEKPFSQDYLEACIHGVLEKRKSMKAAYRESPSAPVVDLADRDEDFIRKLDELVNANIGDASFTNKEMERALFVSRSSLNRRVRVLLGTTPNEYLRKRRLEVAAQMLAEGKARINEISFSVGFNSPSYFAKCFKEAYGMLPAEYMKQKSNK